jgi:hypothetical protein
MRTELDVESTHGVGHPGDVTRLDGDHRWPLYIALVVFNVLDLITTAVVLDRGGTERNPLVKPIVDGIWDVALVKGLVLVLVAVLLTRCRESRIADLALAGTTGWYIAVVIWNCAVLALL